MFYFVLFQLVTFVLLVHFFVKRKYNFWRNFGVRGPAPSLFKLGNALQIGANPSVNELELVRKYGRLYGNYSAMQPVLTIADAELIKQVMVKDFAAFNNRRELAVSHEMIHNNMFFTDDASRWKRLRTLISPNFTSGRLRKIMSMMDRSVDKLVDYLDHQVKTTDDGVFDPKKIMSGFSLDVFASTSFGIDTNTNNDRSEENVLLNRAVRLFDISPVTAVSYFTMPKWVNRLINVQHFLNVDCFEYFEKTAREVVRMRKQNLDQKGVTKRNDLVDLLMDAAGFENDLDGTNYENLTADMDKEESSKQTADSSSLTKPKTLALTETEIIAQMIGFFVAGFETSASAITDALFELAQNPDIQERLVTELTNSLEGLDVASEEYYDTVVNKIPYLDAVIKETLRKYPLFYRLERRCVVDNFKLAGIPLQKDQLIEIAYYAVHYDPEYFPEPERFNPDRFMPENKHLLVPYSFLPFGQGPRNCMGMRFAYQEIKLCLTKIVRQFVFRPTPKTPTKLQLSNYNATLATKHFELKVELRT